MKKIALILLLLMLSGCATPYLDRLMYEDQLNANNRNYLLYRESREIANHDKIRAGLEPESILSQDEWQRTQAPDHFVTRYEREHLK